MIMNIRNKLLFGSALALFNAPAAIAQANDPAAPPSTDRTAAPAEIGEIVVTARRREESLSRVPITVNALSQDALAERSIRSLDQLSQSVPGLTFGASGGSSNPQIVIRGQDRPNLGEAAPPVVTYFAHISYAVFCLKKKI